MLFTSLKGFKWVKEDVRMLFSMVEMSTKKKAEQKKIKEFVARVRAPAAQIVSPVTRQFHRQIQHDDMKKSLIYIIAMMCSYPCDVFFSCHALKEFLSLHSIKCLVSLV